MSRQTRRADDFVDAVLTASRVLVAVSARSLGEVEEAVTVTQFRTLVVLHTRDSTNLNGLAEGLGVTPSTALRMIEKLLGLGLVTRTDNPANRREVLLDLTAEGSQLVDDVTRRRRAEISRIVGRMPTAQRAELAAALRAFAVAAGEPQVAGGVTAFGW